MGVLAYWLAVRRGNRTLRRARQARARREVSAASEAPAGPGPAAASSPPSLALAPSPMPTIWPGSAATARTAGPGLHSGPGEQLDHLVDRDRPVRARHPRPVQATRVQPVGDRRLIVQGEIRAPGPRATQSPTSCRPATAAPAMLSTTITAGHSRSLVVGLLSRWHTAAGPPSTAAPSCPPPPRPSPSTLRTWPTPPAPRRLSSRRSPRFAPRTARTVTATSRTRPGLGWCCAGIGVSARPPASVPVRPLRLPSRRCAS